MSGRALSVAQAGLSLAGAAVTGYLLSVRWGGGTLYCSTGGCETVHQSASRSGGRSAYLLVIQLAVIGEICQWCVASDLITTLVAMVALLRLREVLADVRPA